MKITKGSVWNSKIWTGLSIRIIEVVEEKNVVRARNSDNGKIVHYVLSTFGDYFTDTSKPKTYGRFYVTNDGGWILVDTEDGTLVGFETKAAALEAGRFAREYVRLHGDIDFSSFPYSLETPLTYDKWNGREREYKEDLVANTHANN